MIIIPYAAVRLSGERRNTVPHIQEKDKDDIFNMEITLYRTKSQKVEKIKCYDYICAVVAGEMPASYNCEALKAQTVAAFTYLINKMNYVNQNPDSDIGHNGAYVCDDYTHCKAYLERQNAIKKWGRSWYEKYYPNIENAVLESLGRIITYNGTPINAVFHALSNGVTCSAKDVWGTDVPYLQSVDSSDDKKAPDYESRVVLTHDQFSEKLYSELGVVMPQDSSEWLGDIKMCDSGMVDEITIGQTAYPGTLIRKLFSLRSASFSVEINDKEVIFTSYGYGHGVGMSQYGADKMAEKGALCDEILKHYYSGVDIEDYKV